MPVPWRPCRPILAAVTVVSLTGLAAYARTPAQELEDKVKDETNAAALVAAPWVICDFDPTARQGMPEATGLRWDRASRTFVPLGRFETFGPGRVVFAFDDDKGRATELVPVDPRGAPDGHMHSRGDAWQVLYRERLHERRPFPVVLANLTERVVLGTVTISYLQSADGRFAAVFQAVRLPGGFFFFGPIQWDFSTEQSLGSCTTTADDALTQQIERARAEWLAAPEVPPEPIGNPGTQQ